MRAGVGLPAADPLMSIVPEVLDPRLCRPHASHAPPLGFALLRRGRHCTTTTCDAERPPNEAVIVTEPPRNVWNAGSPPSVVSTAICVFDDAHVAVRVMSPVVRLEDRAKAAT